MVLIRRTGSGLFIVYKFLGSAVDFTIRLFLFSSCRQLCFLFHVVKSRYSNTFINVLWGTAVTMMEIYNVVILSIVFLNFFFMYGEIGRNYHIALLFKVFIRLCFFYFKIYLFVFSFIFRVYLLIKVYFRFVFRQFYFEHLWILFAKRYSCWNSFR